MRMYGESIEGKAVEFTNDIEGVEVMKQFNVPGTVTIWDYKSLREKTGITVQNTVKTLHAQRKLVMCIAYGGAEHNLDIYADEAIKRKKDYKTVIDRLNIIGYVTCELPFPEGV